ncbi:unnamed protein product [Adineta steineri]|uniref:F-box domain-containing protein n=1 Tax=Adineta steineri TaxID=433720 RepID=A0A813RD61_9BILA|nr:unnamed protein product [Adineta steineri]CAF3700434.1 unnamed protein product [Adineta steineri]
MNNAISTIETFSNELLIEIFEYISPYDLYKAFFNLNRRFNFIIKSLNNFHVILQEDWDDKRSIPFFASQISKLIIKHDDFIDFSYYSNIRLLKLSMPTENQCNAIQPSLLPYLEYLYISNFFFADHSKQLCRLIFSPAFSYLRICQIDRITLDESRSYLFSPLHQLTISPSTWKSNIYQYIFNACPNLVDLRIIRLRNLPFKLSSNIICSHTSLRCLYIHFYSIEDDWYDHIEWLLSNVPNLENFILIIDQNELNFEFPFSSLADLLMQHVPNLINFKTKIPLNNFLSNDLNTIRRFHPLFTTVKFYGYINKNLNSYLLITSQK